MDVFDLAAKLTLDSSDYEKGIADAANASNSFGNVAKGVAAGAAGVVTTVAAVSAAAVAAGKSLYDNVAAVAANGDEIDKQSQKLSISAEMYQKLSYACDLSGASIENLKRGITNITDDLAAVAAGGDETATKFGAIGVSAYDAAGNIKDSETVMYESLLALADMADETERNAAANEIFGRSYQELLPLLNSGSEGIASMMNEAEQFGMVMSDENVAAAAGFQDALTQLQGTFSGVKNDLLADFLPSITTVMDGFSDLLAGNEGAGDKISDGFMSAIENIQELMPRIFDMIETMLPAVMEVAPQLVEALVSGIVETLPQLIPAAVQMVDSLLNTILDMLPDILDAGIQIIVSLIDGVAQMLPTLIPKIVQTIVDLITTLLSNVDMILDAALGLIEGLAAGIIEALPILIDALPEIILGIVNFILSAIPQIIDVGIKLLLSLVDALPEIIDGIVKAIPEIIVGIITALSSAIPQLIQAGIELFIALIGALPEIIIEIVKAIPQIIDGIIEGLIDAWPQIKKAGLDLFTNLGDGLAGSEALRRLKEMVLNIGNKIKEGFVEFIEKAKTWGKDLIDSFLSGIKDKIQAVKDTVSSVAQTVKDFLGFSEPEKGPLSNFHTYAPDMIDLFTKGIYESESKLTNAITDVFDVEDKINAGTLDIESSGGNNTIAQLLAQYLPQLANMRVVMDTGATVGQLAPTMDTTLQRMSVSKARYI